MAWPKMMCCTKSIKDSCNKKNEKYKQPRPPPPTTTTTTTVTRIVTLYKEAKQRGRERTEAMTVEERERLTDAELWAEAVEQLGGKKASAVTPMAPGRSGSSCATNQAKPEAHGQAEIEEQEPFLRPWKECQCRWFCLVWKDFPTGERVDNVNCHREALQMMKDTEKPVCPGGWWRLLEPVEHCAAKAPIYSRRNQLTEAYPKIVVAELGVKAVISFGGQTGKFLKYRVPADVDFNEIGFGRAKFVKENLPGELNIPGGEHLVYIDKMELANLDGGYESAKGVRNCYWASY
ncbi:unnamed protein product [Effrenium voratum]|uniref:Uncharacterized protein n=1 Tax=Effrenium voratum TaxID=2562239 RepID=A0AA36HZU3_9DINO|nr:unnamed protein product [Effrenium voratum]CAJ1450336.1 unnamed protein product [Effrenium voratum]CAJ1453677.1 unnamed protein product [Effrenium voratum]